MTVIRRRFLSFVITIVSGLFCFVMLSYFFFAEKIEITSASVSVSKEAVEIGEPFEISLTLGTASSENEEKTKFSLFIDNPNIDLLNFNDGSYTVTLPNGELMTYTTERTDSGVYIYTDELLNGTTIQIKFDARFNKTTSRDEDTANIKIIYNGDNYSETTIKVDSNPKWEDEKTGPSHINVVQKNGTAAIQENITYSIIQHSYDTDGIKDITMSKVRMYDTITFPNGMYIKNGEDVVNALGLQSVQNKNLSYETVTDGNGNITSVKFSFEDTPSDNMVYNFTLNNNCFGFNESFSTNSVITNTLNTKLTSEFGTEYSLDEKRVDTNITYTTVEDYISDFNKSVLWSSSYSFDWENGSWGSVQKGDIIKYKISFINNAFTVMDYDLKDVLPDGMVIATESDFSIVNSWDKDNEGNPILPVTIIGDSKNSNYSVNGNEIVWNLKNIAQGEKVDCYVYVKVVGDENRTLTNKAYLDGKEDSHTVNQTKYDENIGDITIEKTADYNGTMIDTEFTYTITVKSTSKEPASGRSIKDVIPSQLEVLDVSVSHCGQNCIAGDININNNILNISNITVAPPDCIRYSVRVKIKEGGKPFENTVDLFDANGQKEDSAKFSNDLIEAYDYEKKSSASTVFPGDEFYYTIAFNNFNGGDIDYSNNNLIIRDSVPKEFSILDVSYTANGNEVTSGISINNNDIVVTYNGVLKGKESVVVTVRCKVNDISEDSLVIKNTAYIGDKEVSADVTIFNESSDLNIIKKAYNEEGKETNEIDAGDTLTFRIFIENNDDKLPANRLVVKDITTEHILNSHHQSGNIELKVVDSKNVTGLNSDVLISKQNWNNMAHEYNFILSNKEEDASNSQCINYNKDFSLGPGGYIVLEYTLKASDNFNTGRNTVILNDKWESFVDLTAEKIPIIDIQKTTDKNTYSFENIDSVGDFYYTIRVDNKSEGNEFFQKFVIKDFLPEGIEPTMAWYGGTWPSFEITHYKKSGYSYKLWSFDKGGQAYVHIEDNVFYIEFGSTTDDGRQMLVEFQKGDYYEIKIKCHFSEETIKNIKNSDLSKYPIALFDNVVTLETETPFRDLDGNIINNIEDNEVIEVVPVTPYPGIEKVYDGAFTGIYDDNIKDTARPGDNLIWTINIINKSNDNTCGNLSNFIVEDYIPDGYVYEDTGFPDEMYLTIGEEKQQIEWREPTIDGNKLTWNFSDSSIPPNSTLTIKMSLKGDGTNSYGTVVNRARLITTDKIISETISSGEQIEDNVLEDIALTDVAYGKTTSYKEIYYLPTGNHRFEPQEAHAIGYNSYPNNIVQGYPGEKVYYKLSVFNESSLNLYNLCFIDRMPFVGDTGIVSNYDRNSAFEVIYDDLASVVIRDEKGNIVQDVTDKTSLSFSNNKTGCIKDFNKDWLGEDDAFEWHDTFNEGDVNIRFMVDKDIVLEEMQYVEIIFTGYVPEYAKTGIENIAWNNFSYSYNSLEIDELMIAEPAKVGVWVEKHSDTGEIELTKKLLPVSSSEKTFYFALFKEVGDSFEKCSSIESITLQESGVINFKDIPFGEYYVFETDIYGNILEENGENVIIGQGTKVVLDEENSFQSVEIQNMINETTKLVIHKICNENNNIPLQGAVFELYDGIDNVFIAESDENGYAVFDDIPYGTYKLKEIKAPEGYRLLHSVIDVVLLPGGENENNEFFVEVDNIKEIYMPATGSIGNLPFIILGALILIFILFFNKNVLKKSL